MGGVDRLDGGEFARYTATPFMTPPSQKPLYEGKAKQLFPGPEPETFLMHFKNSATAFNNQKKAEIEEKGVLNQKISSKIFLYLAEKGIASHYIRSLSDTDMLVRKVTILPVEVVVRNIAAGSIVKRLGIKEKSRFAKPLVEFFLKNDELGDPLLTTDHIQIMKLATLTEVSEMTKLALRINELLIEYFERLGIVLADFKVEFGKDAAGEILLADEITPDGCRLWDKETGNILDKDRFRKDLGGMREAYQEVWRRMEAKKS